MKRRKQGSKPKNKIDWVAVARQVRTECNKLTDEEREKLFEEGLRMIYGGHAKSDAGSR
jgi:hypothetical protein